MKNLQKKLNKIIQLINKHFYKLSAFLIIFGLVNSYFTSKERFFSYIVFSFVISLFLIHLKISEYRQRVQIR
jgi:hypothetical protein